MCTYWAFLLSYINAEYVCYDNTWHLRRYANNPARSGLTPCTRRLSSKIELVEKMHMVGHTDLWCRKYCDPILFKELEKVRKQYHLYISMTIMHVCTVLLGGHRSVWTAFCMAVKVRKDDEDESQLVRLLYICEVHNTRKELKLHRGGYMWFV